MARWLSLAETRQLTGLSRKDLLKLADTGEIRTRRLNDKGWRRYHETDVQKFTGADRPNDPLFAVAAALSSLKDTAEPVLIDAESVGVGPHWRALLNTMAVIESRLPYLKHD